MSTTRLLLQVFTFATVCALDADTKERLIQAHGCMMVCAWFIFVATAIMFARYFKGHWPETKPMGLLIWFHFHRTFNMIAVLLMIAAFVCIFTANNWQWLGPPQNITNDTGVSVHAMVGLLALVLAWSQPIGALFRCDPGTPLRPIFNWLHRLAGLTAWVLAATAVITINLPSQWASQLAVAIAYLVVIGVVLILQELITIIERIRNRNSSQINALEMETNGRYPGSPITSSTSSTTETNRKTKLARLVLMGLFVVIGWGLAIALIVMIALS